MPINPIILQRRHAELGRIRLGHKGEKGQPVKLSTVRFTSPSERYIRDIATLYGGTAKPWDNGGKPEWEVYTDAKSIPVIVVRGGLSQWMETWSGGGCVHRCDGVTDTNGNTCDPDDPKHKAAKPTTRLSVMLTELEAVGVFRLESHGWNAAAEIPNAAELAAYVGELVRANITLVERRAIKNGKTSRFVVPVLDLEVSQRRLLAIADAMSNGQNPALAAGPSALAIEGPAPDYLELLDGASTTEECTAIWHQAGRAGHLTDDLKAAITARGNAINAAAALAQPAPAPQPDEDGVIDGEVVEDDPAAADATWMLCVQYAGGTFGWTSKQLMDAFAAHSGKTTEVAGASDFAVFLQAMKDGTVTVPGAVA